MAYREIGMWEILEVLRWVSSGSARLRGSPATAAARSAAGGAQARLGTGSGRTGRGASGQVILPGGALN